MRTRFNAACVVLILLTVLIFGCQSTPRSGQPAKLDSSARQSETDGATSYHSGKIALVQYDADRVLEKYETKSMASHAVTQLWTENINALKIKAEQSVKAGANIVVFPEGSTYGYSTPHSTWCRSGYPFLRDFRLHESKNDKIGKRKKCLPAEAVVEEFPHLSSDGKLTGGGRTTRFWSQFAKDHNVYVIYSVPEKAIPENDGPTPIPRDGEMPFYNSIGIVGPQGFVTKYRKRILYINDQMYAVAGKNPAIFDSEFGKFGLMICADAFDTKAYGQSPAQPGGFKFDSGNFDLYKARGINQIIIVMNWDDDRAPASAKEQEALLAANPNNDDSAVLAMEARAKINNVHLYVSDNSKSDGTGLYGSRQKRDRTGMPDYFPFGAGIVLVPIQ